MVYILGSKQTLIISKHRNERGVRRGRPSHPDRNRSVLPMSGIFNVT